MVTLFEYRVNCGKQSYKNMLKPISSHKELRNFLLQRNKYSEFIKQKIQRKQLEHIAYKTEIHHIIPYHAGGKRV